MTSNDSRMSKAERREAARRQAEQLREQRLRQERRTRILIIGGVVAAVAIFGVLLAFILREGSKPELERVVSPSAVDENGTIPVGASGVAGEATEGATVVRVYSDYRCPACGAFEAMHHEMLGELREAGEITLEYNLVTFLDRGGDNYSTRSTSAAATVADQAPEHFVAFHNALFANQPGEGMAPWTDEQLAELAVQAGVPQEVADQFAAEKFTSWAKAVTNQATQDGVTGTPTVLIDGEVFAGDWREEGVLREAIEAAG